MATNPFTSAQAGPSYMGGQALTNPEIIALDRQRKMAEMLLKKGMEGQPEGQNVSGYYVPPSFAQRLSPVLNRYLGEQGLKEVDEKSARLAEMLREKEAVALADYMRESQGRPAVPDRVTEMAGPYSDNVPMPTATIAGTPAVAGNRQMAFINVLQNPNAPSWLKQEAIKRMTADPEGYTLAEGAVRFERQPDGTVKQVAAGASKNPDKIQTAAIVLGLDSKPRSEWTAQDRSAIDAQIQKTQQSGAINLGQKGFDNTLKLRGDFRSEPVYKGFQEIESAFSQINAGLNAKSPAGDLAAATKFMKLLDPTSVVRESELAMAMQATGALDRLYNIANLAATGQKLTPTQREDFRRLGNEFYTTSYNQYNTKRDEYSDIAKRNELNVNDVVGKPPKAPTVTLPPVFAINQATGERIQSTDGGNTWKPAPKAK
jgi:hypothetical protein